MLLILCMGSVSANDDNATAEMAVNDLQDETLAIDEYTTNDDIVGGEKDNVVVENEKNSDVLKSTNENERLGAWYSTEIDIFDEDHKDSVNYVSIGDSADIYNNITSSGSMYNYLYSKPEVIIYVNGEQVGTMWGYQDNQPVFSSYSHDPYTINFDKEGWWNVTAKYNADDYYFASSTSNTLYYFVGTPAQETETTIELNFDSVKPGETIAITPKVVRTDDNTEVTAGSIEIYINDILNATIDAGTSFDYTNSVEGTYSVFAKYLGNDDFKESTSASKTFLISNDPSLTPVTVSISLDKTAVGPDEQITITSSVLNNEGSDISGTVDIYDENDEIIAKDVQIGTPYSFTHNQAAGSSHEIYAKYLGNDELKYAPATSNKVSYKVKKELTIALTANDEESIDIAPSSYGSVSVTFNADFGDATPAWTLYLNDEEWDSYEAGTTSTTISFDSSDLGSNELYVKFAGDDDYLESVSNKVYVNVYQNVRVTPSIDLNSTLAVEGEKILVTVTASSNAPGNITLYADSSYSEEIATIPVGESYEYVIPVTDKTSSYYTGYIYAYYNTITDGNTIYEHNPYASGYKSFTVMKQNTAALTANGKTDVNVDVDELVVLHLDLDYFTPTSGYDSNYNTVYYSNVVIYLDGEEIGQFDVERISSGYSYEYSLADFSFAFNESDVGQHTVYAYYKGSQSYSSYTAPATSNVINVNVGVVPSNLNAENLTMTYKDGSTWDVALTDSEGNAISNVPIKIGIVGKVYTVKTNDDGIASLPINLNPGTYDVNATFDGKDNILGSFIDANIVVNKAEVYLSSDNVVMNYKNGSWSVNLTDAAGNAIANAVIKVGININGVDKVYNRQTGADGVASLPINLAPGTYSINATFNGNAQYGAAFTNATVTVNKAALTVSAADITMGYKDGSTYRVIVDDKGNPVTNINVKVTVGTKDYNIKTDSNGVAELPINIAIGHYTVSATIDDAKYESNSISNSITVNVDNLKISANDVVMSYKDGTEYMVQLVDGNGNSVALAGQIIKITVKGKTYDRKTDASGIAKLPINLIAGNYTVSSSFNDEIITNEIVVNK